MSKRRTLKFADPEAVIAEVRRLRAGCEKTGNWSLAQICWHLNIATRASMRAGPHESPQTNPQTQERLQRVLESGSIPGGVPAPEIAVPPAQVDDAVVDEFIAAMTALKNFKGPFAPHRLFGVVPDEDFRRLHLIHSAHHLGHLIPAGE